jgi:calcineurin-like phosphoesterase family protein
LWNIVASRVQTSRPRIADDMRIYAVGDLHGRADLLEALLARIDADLTAYPIAQSVQVFLGDYIDRGAHSRKVLDLLIKRQRQHTTIYLMGNHENYAAEFIRNPSAWSAWKAIGGVNTLLSYGVTPLTRGDRHERQELSVAFGQALPDDHGRFLESLALSFTCGDFFFAHAGVRPGIPLEQQSQIDLLWIREDFLLHEEDFGRVVVHGHTPAIEPDIKPNRINIDTGAYATGRLTCLVLEGDEMRFI